MNVTATPRVTACDPPLTERSRAASLMLWGLLMTLASCGGGAPQDLASTNAAPATASSNDAAPSASRHALAGSDVKLSVFNAPSSAKAGDMINVQGENLGPAPVLQVSTLTGVTQIAAISTFGGTSASFQLPKGVSPLAITASNGAGGVTAVGVGAPIVHHLDSKTLSPGSTFRIFGRNLNQLRKNGLILVNGTPASIVKQGFDDQVLALTLSKNQSIANGLSLRVYGAGAVAIFSDPGLKIVAGDGASHPLGLDVPWESALAQTAGNIVTPQVNCNFDEVTQTGADNSDAIQQAVNQAAQNGGGIVKLPAGNCLMTNGIQMFSGVVLQGAGKDATTISYRASNPGANALWAQNLDRVGYMDFTYQNLGHPEGDGKVRRRVEAPIIRNSTRSFVKNVRFNLAGGVKAWFFANTDMVIADSEFNQPAWDLQSGDQMDGVLQMSDNAGFIFVRNKVLAGYGGSDIARSNNAYFGGNRFMRDMSHGAESADMVYHSLAINFAHRIAIIDNTFDVVNGSVTNKYRNDGETILTEGGGGERTESIGKVVSADRVSLISDRSINANPFPNLGSGFPAIPQNFGIAIVGGKGAGQTRRVLSVNLDGAGRSVISVDAPWDSVPDSSSRFGTFVWGLEKALIRGNTLIGNPRGIWFYQTAIREVLVSNNSIINGGGFYFRSFQWTDFDAEDKSAPAPVPVWMFTPIYGVQIIGNRNLNSDGVWPASLRVSFVRRNEEDFGYAVLGLEVRKNEIKGTSPEWWPCHDESVPAQEGYVVRMAAEGPSQGRSLSQARIVGTVFQDNTCTNCTANVYVPTTPLDGARDTTEVGTVLINSRAGAPDGQRPADCSTRAR